MDTGTRIAHLRQKRGVSRRELARALGVNQSTVAYWERGQTLPRRETFNALLVFFETTQEKFYTAKVAR